MTTRGTDPGHHDTRKRQAILRALAHAPGFLTATALHDRLRHAGDHIGLSTVYRTLRHYTRTGDVETTRDDAGTHLFRANPTHTPGPWLICRHCGHSTPIPADIPRRWATTTAARHDFHDIHLIIRLAGTCRTCAQSRDEGCDPSSAKAVDHDRSDDVRAARDLRTRRSR